MRMHPRRSIPARPLPQVSVTDSPGWSGSIVQSAAGFTLIELLMVLMLIAVVTGMAIPRMNMSRFRADAAMRTVQAILQQAQRAAIQHQTDVIVSFDTINAQIRIVYDQNNNHAIDSGEPVYWRALEEGSRFADPPKRVDGSTSGASVLGHNMSLLGAGQPTVYYRRDGAVSSNFEVYVRSSSNSLTDFRGLSVSQATGRVEVYRMSTGSVWKRGSL